MDIKLKDFEGPLDLLLHLVSKYEVDIYDVPIVDIIEQENTEDFQKMAGMEPNEQPYLKTPVLTLAKNRIVWLLVLMISATVTGSIIQGFEEVLQSVVILASFIPMLMDTGGNSGSQ